MTQDYAPVIKFNSKESIGQSLFNNSIYLKRHLMNHKNKLLHCSIAKLLFLTMQQLNNATIFQTIISDQLRNSNKNYAVRTKDPSLVIAMFLTAYFLLLFRS